MSTIYLVRHAQASFGTDDYDRLSALGHRQARWLGDHMATRGLRFTRALSGTMRRQRETAENILSALDAPPPVVLEHPGLNEYDGDAIYRAFTAGADQIAHQRRDYRDYWKTFRLAMLAWADGSLEGVPETWAAFGDRMLDGLREAAAGLSRDDAALVVSSGGAISRVLTGLIQAPAAVAIELNLQFRNTGFCELVSVRDGFRVVSFNCIPHLEHPDRADAITHA
ncbi:MAG: histidine phosphatase family protein [Burkholderiaceae bacterium]|nr:histidine phosphatase family protein [Burkholderiaceae bacterium]